MHLRNGSIRVAGGPRRVTINSHASSRRSVRRAFASTGRASICQHIPERCTLALGQWRHDAILRTIPLSRNPRRFFNASGVAGSIDDRASPVWDISSDVQGALRPSPQRNRKQAWHGLQTFLASRRNQRRPRGVERASPAHFCPHGSGPLKRPLAGRFFFESNDSIRARGLAEAHDAGRRVPPRAARSAPASTPSGDNT